MKKFISGNDAAVQGALASGAQAMYGYPITPSTEILQIWSEEADKNDRLIFLQTEDETTAGFAVNGSVLMGVKAFTATSGPGTVLMQDGLSMAENLRLPTVTIVMQRGGPSTGQVNYSQQELNLAVFGGNGEGLRIVYSAGTPQEMYDFTLEAFDSAWRYKFPTLVLGDGYIGKQKTEVELKHPLNPYQNSSLLAGKNLRNCYSSEEQFYEYLSKNILDFEEKSSLIARSESIGPKNAPELIVAHGSVFFVIREALKVIDPKSKKYQLFRPVTLRPFPKQDLKVAARGKKKIWFFESSYGQLYHLVSAELDAASVSAKIIKVFKPAYRFLPEDIADSLKGGK